MNRRNFINSLLTIGAGFTILPSAGRIWKAEVSLYERLPYHQVKGLLIPQGIIYFLPSFQDFLAMTEEQRTKVSKDSITQWNLNHKT